MLLYVTLQKLLDQRETSLNNTGCIFCSHRYVSRVSINGKEVATMNNSAGNTDYRSSNTPHNPIPLRYQSNNWKNSSGASSGASTGVSPIHSSNEEHNGEERLVDITL